MRPNRLIVRAYVLRGTRLWLLTRAAIAGVFLLAGTDPVRLPTPVMVAFIVLTVVTCFLDTYRHREGAFLGNLGVGPLHLAAIFVTPVLIGELTLRLLAARL
ncbi:MAG: hypothetical protein ACSLFK_07545 [Gemmatimonadaceae bacterium]